MNHSESLSNLGEAYSKVIAEFIKDISGIKNTLHKVEKNQDLDKIIHYFYKVTEEMKDLNDWLTAFGSPEEKL